MRLAITQLATVFADEDVGHLRLVRADAYPLLVLCARAPLGSRPRVLDLVRGTTPRQDTLAAIGQAIAAHADALRAERRDEQERTERDQFRRQQDDDYAQALQADAEADAARQREQRDAIEADRRAAEEQQALAAHRQRLMDGLPVEPPVGDATAATVRLRLPDGRMVDRRFGMQDRLADVFALAGAHGYAHETHRLLTSDYPIKRDVSGGQLLHYCSPCAAVDHERRTDAGRGEAGEARVDHRRPKVTNVDEFSCLCVMIVRFCRLWCILAFAAVSQQRQQRRNHSE